jgi:hypothetical protein
MTDLKAYTKEERNRAAWSNYHDACRRLEAALEAQSVSRAIQPAPCFQRYCADFWRTEEMEMNERQEIERLTREVETARSNLSAV